MSAHQRQRTGRSAPPAGGRRPRRAARGDRGLGARITHRADTHIVLHAHTSTATTGKLIRDATNSAAERSSLSARASHIKG